MHMHMHTYVHAPQVAVTARKRCQTVFSALALSRLSLIHGHGAETEPGFQLQPDLMLHYFAHLYTGYSIFNISS